MYENVSSLTLREIFQASHIMDLIRAKEIHSNCKVTDYETIVQVLFSPFQYTNTKIPKMRTKYSLLVVHCL